MCVELHVCVDGKESLSTGVAVSEGNITNPNCRHLCISFRVSSEGKIGRKKQSEVQQIPT